MGRRRRRRVPAVEELMLEGFEKKPEGQETLPPPVSFPSPEDHPEDLPEEPGVVQRSVPPEGSREEGADGPEIALQDRLPGDLPRMAPGEEFPAPDPAGSIPETPVQDTRAVPFRQTPPAPPEGAPRPAEPQAQLASARELIHDGRISEAVTLLRSLVEAEPRSVEARVELGILLDRTGAHAPAVEHLEAALRSSPESVEILSALGAAFTGLGRFDEAERELRRAQRIAPEDLVVRTNLAIVSFRRGLYGHAEAELRWVCDRDEGNSTAHFYRGEALNRLGRVDEALDAMKTVTRLDPGNSRAFYTMGILYDKKHLPTEAAAMYRKAREVSPR